MNDDTVGRAIARGLLGGLVATIVMDAACVAFFALAGMPLDMTYSFIGSIAGNFFSNVGLDLAGSRLLGALVHFLIGPVLGGLFGLVASRTGVFRAGSFGKRVLFAVLYAEIAGQPILATAPLFGDMTAAGILQWYGLSTAMHVIFGIVLGVVCGAGGPFPPVPAPTVDQAG